MVGGQSDKLKIAAVIQARMKSERLPGKILLPLPLGGGKPILGWIIDSLKRSFTIQEIVLASSKNSENDSLVSFAFENSIDLFRGEEDDVLSRFIAVCRKWSFDVVARITGDNPIVDSQILDEVVSQHLENVNDYTYTTGLPLGMNFEVVSSKALYQLENKNLTKNDKEHVTLYIRSNSNDFKVQNIRYLPDKELENLRLTVDYPSDFAALSLILSILKPGTAPGMQLVREVKENYPWIFEINRSKVQKKAFSNLNDELKEAVFLLNQLDLRNAAQILLEKTLTNKA